MRFLCVMNYNLTSCLANGDQYCKKLHVPFEPQMEADLSFAWFDHTELRRLRVICLIIFTHQNVHTDWLHLSTCACMFK